MGIGVSQGEDRAVEAARQATSSPLLETSIDGAKGVLLSITGDENLGLFEVNEAAAVISEASDPDANIIFGAVIDETLEDEMRVTVIATGFSPSQTTRQRERESEEDSMEDMTIRPLASDDGLEIPEFLRKRRDDD
jgi:cell division protein FtsZ